MLQIIIGQRGFVWVGETTRTGDEIVIKNARCIRRWGTENKGGLGYLATNGPTPTTVLEDPANLTLHILSVVGRFDCVPKTWGM